MKFFENFLCDYFENRRAISSEISSRIHLAIGFETPSAIFLWIILLKMALKFVPEIILRFYLVISLEIPLGNSFGNDQRYIFEQSSVNMLGNLFVHSCQKKSSGINLGVS